MIDGRCVGPRAPSTPSAARAAWIPSDVGLPVGGTRRVKGLRREEVAVPAGVSADYYIRREQGPYIRLE
ncbi:hypothetical protein ACFVRU_22170 [Streptomyces sp. NPDC057927]